MPFAASARVPVGKTGLELSRLGMGTTTLGGLHSQVADADCVATVEAALEAGIRLYDTAPQYGTGLSEQRLGSALQGRKRSDFVLSTKVGKIVVPKGSGGNPQPFFFGTGDEIIFDYTYDGTMRSIEESLKRLGLDRIDMLFIHDVTRRHQGDRVEERYREAIGGAYKALDRLRREGTVRAIGTGITEIDFVTRFLNDGDFDIILLPGRYTLLDQSAADGLFDLCQTRGVSVILAAPFESGILASGAVPGAKYLYQNAEGETLDRVRRIEAVCAQFNVPLSAAALQLPLTHPAVSTVLVGMRSKAEVQQNVARLGFDIPPEFWTALVKAGVLRPGLPSIG